MNKLCTSLYSFIMNICKREKTIDVKIVDVKIVEWKDAIAFVPPVKEGRVIKVYDGDTITIAASLPIPDTPLYRFSVRLRGIDAPEMKGKNEDEKEPREYRKKHLKT